jgi:hypothetical protein
MLKNDKLASKSRVQFRRVLKIVSPVSAILLRRFVSPSALGIHIKTVSTYTYVRTKHLRQASTRVAIRRLEGVKSKS